MMRARRAEPSGALPCPALARARPRRRTLSGSSSAWDVERQAGRPRILRFASPTPLQDRRPPGPGNRAAAFPIKLPIDFA